MAIKNLDEARRQQKKLNRFKVKKSSIALLAAIMILFSITVFACVLPNYAAAAKFNEEAENLRNSIAEMEQESDEIARSLEDEDKLFEKIAREEYGYCKPGEKVYYNSSFGE